MRLALGQHNPLIGDFHGNVAQLKALINAAKHSGAELIVFPELSLTGYYPYDLLDSQSFIDKQDAVLLDLVAYAKQESIAIVVGVAKKTPEGLRNALQLYEHGALQFEYFKRVLPVYNIFDEPRHFHAGTDTGYFEWRGIRLGCLICEDGWLYDDALSHQTPTSSNHLHQPCPVAALSQSGKTLDLVLSIHASPSNLGKQPERYAQFSKVSQALKAPLIYVNQWGGQDDIIYDGMSFAVNADAKLVSAAHAFESSCLVVELDIQQQKLLPVDEVKPKIMGEPMDRGLNLSLEPLPTYQDNASLFDGVDWAFWHLVVGVKDYCRKNGFKSVLVGCSGGIDSAVTLAVAVAALGHEAVSALYMPSRHSRAISEEDSRALARALNISLKVVSIEPQYQVALGTYTTTFGEPMAELAKQNCQARIRGQILMSYANQTHSLLLTTGNKSEVSVGYCTLYGDMAGGYNLLGDLYKTEVYQLARWLNQKKELIPSSIIERPPSAELSDDQLDSDSLPDYDTLDTYLRWYLEGDLLPPNQLNALSTQVVALPSELKKSIEKKVAIAEFKRRQCCPIVRVQRRAFGVGRQRPISAYT